MIKKLEKTKDFESKRLGFTLLELLAVIVILAIIALIATPIILGIIKDSKEKTNERSIEAYKRSLENALLTYQMKENKKPMEFSQIEKYIEYEGTEVFCPNIKLENGVIIFGVCEIKKEKNSIILKTYNIGDVVTYNGIEFYVIKDSDSASNSVTMLKAEPLTTDEVNKYGKGYINLYASSPDTDYYQQASNEYGYGGISFYENEHCRFDTRDFSECSIKYSDSAVKKVVDQWAKDKFNSNNLVVDSTNFSARILTLEELLMLGCSTENCENSKYQQLLYTNNYWYWIMNSSEISEEYAAGIDGVNGGRIETAATYYGIGYYRLQVRPVITIKKSVL